MIKEDTHLELIVSLDMLEIKVSYVGYDAWTDARKAAIKIGQDGGFFHRESGHKMEGKFYPIHRINLVEIRPAREGNQHG